MVDHTLKGLSARWTANGRAARSSLMILRWTSIKYLWVTDYFNI
jgi:hypothetical protein